MDWKVPQQADLVFQAWGAQTHRGGLGGKTLLPGVSNENASQTHTLEFCSSLFQ